MLNQDSQRARGPASACIRIPGKSGPAPALQGARRSGFDSLEQTAGLSSANTSPSAFASSFIGAIGIPHHLTVTTECLRILANCFTKKNVSGKATEVDCRQTHGYLSIRGVLALLGVDARSLLHPSFVGILSTLAFSWHPGRGVKAAAPPGTDRWRLRRVCLFHRGSTSLVFSNRTNPAVHTPVYREEEMPLGRAPRFPRGAAARERLPTSRQ